jgi:hypothetical protein
VVGPENRQTIDDELAPILLGVLDGIVAELLKLGSLALGVEAADEAAAGQVAFNR